MRESRRGNTGESGGIRGKLLFGMNLVAEFDKGFWVHFQDSGEIVSGASSHVWIVTLEAFKLGWVFVTSSPPDIYAGDSLPGFLEDFYNVGIYCRMPASPGPVFAVR